MAMHIGFQAYPERVTKIAFPREHHKLGFHGMFWGSETPEAIREGGNNMSDNEPVPGPSKGIDFSSLGWCFQRVPVFGLKHFFLLQAFKENNAKTTLTSIYKI